MRWNRRVLVLVLIPFGLAAVALSLGRGRELSYHGRGLSEWVSRYQALETGEPESAEALDAILRIGTNTLPELVRMLAYDPAPRRKRVAAIGRTLPGILRWRIFMQPLLIDQREFGANAATLTLAALGPEAGRELPNLARLANETNSAVVSRRAMRVLTQVGNLGVAPVMVVLTNRQHPYRVFAMDYIGDFGTNAAIAIPELEQALQGLEPGGAHPRYEQSEEGRAVGGLHGETRSLRSPLASASFPPQPIETLTGGDRQNDLSLAVSSGGGVCPARGFQAGVCLQDERG